MCTAATRLQNLLRTRSYGELTFRESMYASIIKFHPWLLVMGEGKYSFKGHFHSKLCNEQPTLINHVDPVSDVAPPLTQFNFQKYTDQISTFT